MTFNWGHKLTLAFLAFTGMMVFLVYKSMHTDFDLVSKEYYKDELQYQQVIDGANRANRLSGSATLVQNGDMITLRLPEEMKNSSVTGEMWFYCADNAKKDRKIALQPNSEAVQQIDSRQFIPGYYTVKISWKSNNELYYTEHTLTIM
jgi:hypothetical protein